MCPIEQALSRPLTAPVFDVQGFSLQDGPGIRTTIFFKGCPLRCKWCHNPESYLAKPQLMFHANLCVGCLACVKACPVGVHKMAQADGQIVHMVQLERCVGCGECLSVCCYDALDLMGKQYTPETLCQVVAQNLSYHKLATNSGSTGGITLSGGEPMLYAPFLEAFLALLPNEHITMETSGYAKTEAYLRLAPSIKLFLFDYKSTDPEMHRTLCGVDNSLILTNLDVLYNAGCEITLRLPLIPGVNDDETHFEGVAALLRRYPRIPRAEIMAYHTLGVGKADSLGIDTPLAGLPAATEEQKKLWLTRFAALGADNVILSS